MDILLPGARDFRDAVSPWVPLFYRKVKLDQLRLYPCSSQFSKDALS